MNKEDNYTGFISPIPNGDDQSVIVDGTVYTVEMSITWHDAPQGTPCCTDGCPKMAVEVIEVDIEKMHDAGTYVDESTGRGGAVADDVRRQYYDGRAFCDDCGRQTVEVLAQLQYQDVET